MNKKSWQVLPNDMFWMMVRLSYGQLRPEDKPEGWSDVRWRSAQKMAARELSESLKDG